MPTAMEETYDDVEMLVHRVVHAFLKRKGISRQDYEEWHAEACLAFVRSCYSYDRKQARFSTHVWHRTWMALAEKLRSEAPHYLAERDRRMNQLPQPNGSRCHIDDWILSLSDDANTVVRIVLGTFGSVDGEEPDPQEARCALHDLLIGLGWSFRRIVEAFHEVKTVLLN